MDFDVIVVGGGPAGSTAARECAARGLRVALLDKGAFPRDKPCGGGVTIRSARLLPFAITPVVERAIHGVRFSARLRTSFVRCSDEPVTFLTQRRHLDTFLLDRARAGGAEVFQKAPVRSIEPANGGYTIRSGGQVLSAAVVIGADGANGMTSRVAGLSSTRWKGIALEGNITIKGQFPREWAETMGVDFGHARGGYGWLFPKGDHVNLGVGGWHGMGPTLRERLDRLTRYYGFAPRELWGLRGHPLPVRLPGSPFIRGRLVLIGDAAGFLDPFTGEGIFAAIWSGRQAAIRVAEFLAGSEDALDWYVADVERELLPDLRVSRKLYDLFHLWPWLWAQSVRTPQVWSLACHLLRGDQTFAGASRTTGWTSSALSVAYEGLKLFSASAPSHAAWGSVRRPLFFCR